MAFEAQLDPKFKEIIDQCEYLLLQKEIPMSIVEEAAVYAFNKGKVVILDCGGQDAPITEKTLDHITYISPNETELLRLDPSIVIAEDFKLEDAAKEIRSTLLTKHPNLRVLLKLGSKGSAVITNNTAVKADSVTLLNPQILKEYKIIDTVGAGDCFTGAFAVKHAELDWSDEKKWADHYHQAMEFGNSAAFLCITKRGAMPSMPFREEVDKFVATYKIK